MNALLWTALALLPPAPARAATLWTPDRALGLTAPAGWQPRDPPGERPEVLFVLEGPLYYSFVMSRTPDSPELDNLPALTAALGRLVDRINRGSGLGLRKAERLRSAAFDNGAVADYLLAREPGRPELLVGLCRFEDRNYVVQIVSSSPEPLFREVLASLVTPASSPGGAATAAPARLRRAFGRRAALVLWLGALAVLAAAMAFFWRRLR